VSKRKGKTQRRTGQRTPHPLLPPEGVKIVDLPHAASQRWLRSEHIDPDGKGVVTVTVNYDAWLDIVTALERETAKLRGARSLRAVDTVFTLISAVLPSRICRDEIGDAMEMINRYVQEGRSPWIVRLKVVTTIFWLLVNTVREVAASFLKLKIGAGPDA
jgi:hypothetical protein